MINAPGQVENLGDELLPESKGEDPDKPRMPFRSSYKLTRVQEDALVNFALPRLDQLSDQLGRKYKDSSTAGQGTGGTKISRIENPLSFMGKRERYTLRYYNHVEDRALGLPGTSVFQESNLTASLSQRITMQMIASAIQFFFGQPDDIDWFSSSAVGAEDETLSDKIKKHARWKVDQCGVKHRFIEGIEFAFVRGEAVMKVTHQERGQIYKRTATILMDPEKPADPLLDAHGDYICQGDRFVNEMAAPEQPEPGLLAKMAGAVKGLFTGPEPGATDGTSENAETLKNGNAETEQQPQLQPTGRQILRRDGVTVLPENPVWHEQEITRRLVTFEGPDAQLVYYQDFIFPENATDVQTADLISHLYDMNVMQVAQMFRGQYGEGDAAIASMAAAIERLREMLNESNAPKAAAGQPRTDFRETDTAGAVGVPQVEIAECYLTYDADGDGVQEEIMLVMDRRSKTPIYYEYLANVTVKGARPFYVWRPMAMDGRIYGMGSMELFDPEQEFIDLQINRHNFRTSNAGIVTFWEPSATVEGARDPNLKLNQGTTYTLRDGKKADDALTYKELPTDAKGLEYLIQLFMQLMQLKSGKVNSGDQEMSGLPASKLATGINEIRETGDELFSRILAHLFPGVKATLSAVQDVMYANMNRIEIFNYFNGEGDEILQLDPDDVRDLPLNVTLELSRTQQRKALENGEKATALVTWFYQLPFQLQQRASGYARQQLKALGVSQADKIIDPLDLSAGQPSGKVSESLAYKDAPPDIKRQIEAQAGLQPSTAETAAAHASTPEEAGTAGTKKTEPAGPAV